MDEEEFSWTGFRLRDLTRSSLLRLLMRQILWYTSALFTTTHVAVDQVYKVFTKTAQEAFGDEMGCTTVPEACMVWRRCRKLTLAGDVYQLLPATLSENQKFGNGGWANPLHLTHKRSILQHLMSLGVPVFVPQEQLRMVPGHMDLSMELFYPDWNLTYAKDNTVDRHRFSAMLEKWAVETLGARPSPEGKVLPIFIHV